ncbi:cysteine methyltransferase [bacterium DOLZORAL124_64_63]|nr:MAG: cysteine methyltransferase [bacterium DOLZORAL124_64_63]
MVRYALLRTVLNPLLAVAGPRGLVWLEFLTDACAYHTRAHAVGRRLFPGPADDRPPEVREDPGPFTDLQEQLALYFTSRLEEFDLPLDLHGTPFQVAVWRQLQTIPYGKLRTYGELALALEKPRATRAVGQAAGHNPLPILVPCHRLIGKSGDLVGFAGGISTKARLLRLEGHYLSPTAQIEEPRLF